MGGISKGLENLNCFDGIVTGLVIVSMLMAFLHPMSVIHLKRVCQNQECCLVG